MTYWDAYRDSIYDRLTASLLPYPVTSERRVPWGSFNGSWRTNGCYCNTFNCEHKEKKMKETTETIKMRLYSVDRECNTHGRIRMVVKGEGEHGGRVEIPGLSIAACEELQKIVISGHNGEIEVTVKIKRPETPKEEVERMWTERGPNAALVRALELLK